MGKPSFDSFYQSRDWYYQLEPSEELAHYVIERAHDGGKALDLGCGEGRDTIFLASHGFQVIAVDLSWTAIEKLSRYARKNDLPISCVVHDVDCLSIPQNHFDLINAVTILDHVEPGAVVQLANRIEAGLTANGVLFAEAFTIDDPGYLNNPERASETALFVRNYFGPGELRRLFPGLKIIKYEEKSELDTSHGHPHRHNVAILIATK